MIIVNVQDYLYFEGLEFSLTLEQQVCDES